MAKLNARATRIPVEFNDLLIDLTKQASLQTGMPENKTATLRRMGTQLKGKLIAKGLDFDMIVIDFRKKKK